MAILTNIEMWLDQVESDLENNADEVHSLYLAVKDEGAVGNYEVKKQNHKIIVCGGGADDELHIPSNEAKKLFLKMLVDRFVPKDQTLEGWRTYQKDMSKDD